MAGALLLGAAVLWWLCQRSDSVPFLPASGPAEWIVYPTAFDAVEHDAATFSVTFRHSFKLATAPGEARLHARAFKQGTVRINGELVSSLLLDGRNWKRSGSADAARFLRVGENEISVTVSNRMGPPALWLWLEAGEGRGERGEGTGENPKSSRKAGRNPKQIRNLSADEPKGTVLRTDGEWEVAVDKGAWQKAALASEPPRIGPGNPLFGRERTGKSLGRVWPNLVGIVLVVGVVVAGAMRTWAGDRGRGASTDQHGATRTNTDGGGSGKWQVASGRIKADPAVTVLALIVISWGALFCNNLRQLPPELGFDRDGHLYYIDYILQKKALPLADEGWQTYQPPLYYLLSAGLVAPFPLSEAARSVGWRDLPKLPDWRGRAALLALRAFSAATGITQIVLIFLCLRLWFPNRPSLQVVGLLVAGFLPASLCLSHHVTNEPLAAVFVTGAMYFTLRILSEGRREKGEGRRTEYAAVGVCLGLAMLTKFSALLAVPVICGVLLWAEWRRRETGESVQCSVFSIQSALANSDHRGAQGELRNAEDVTRVTCHVSPVTRHLSRLTRCAPGTALALAAMLLVCGWHYIRVWRHFGQPLVGNWDARLPIVWWQEPGFHTSSWCWHFADTFVSPVFSSLAGFADGVYSSLWGDGLCSGATGTAFRPPWDYDLMNAGYVLALVPTLLIFIGTIAACARFLRVPEAEEFSAVPSGLVPSRPSSPNVETLGYSHGVPPGRAENEVLCLGMVFAFLAGILLMSLRVASYAQVKAFYALPALLPLCVLAARGWEALVRRGIAGHEGGAARSADFPVPSELRTEPRLGENVSREYRRTLLRTGKSALRAGLAVGMVAWAIVVCSAFWIQPGQPLTWTMHGMHAAGAKRYDEAIESYSRALRLDPRYPLARVGLADALAQAGRVEEARREAGEAVRQHPDDPAARFELASVLALAGRDEEALRHFHEVIARAPDHPGAHQQLALSLSRSGRYREAIAACREGLVAYPLNFSLLNNLAWMLATNPEATVRDGPAAVSLAEKACRLTSFEKAVLIGTLAAAYAEAGRFGEAVSAAERARGLALASGQMEVAKTNEELLRLYRAGRAYHEEEVPKR